MSKEILSGAEPHDHADVASASFIVNRHHQVVDSHPSIESIMAWPSADLTGHLLEELIHPDDLPTLESLLSSTAPEVEGQVILIRLQHATEGWVWVNLAETAPFDSEQRHFEVVRQQPLEAVKPPNTESSSELADDLMDLLSAQNQILVFDQFLDYLWSSPGFNLVFSADAQGLHATALSEFCNSFQMLESAPDSPPVNPIGLSSTEGWQGNIITTIQGIATPLYLVSQHQNLAKTQQAVLVLTFSAAQTAPSPEAAPVDVFSSVRDIAHEFRNVFGVISGHTELMRSNPSANQSNSINQLSRYSRKAIDLLESLTLLGYLDDDRPTHFNPMSHVNTLDPLLRLIAGDRLTLNRQDDLADFECFGRPADFDHALLATVRSATALTESSGQIQVSFTSAYSFLTMIFKLEKIDLSPLQASQAEAGAERDLAVLALEQFKALSALGAEYRAIPSLEIEGNTLSLIISLPGEAQPTDTREPNAAIERAIKQALLIEDDPGVRDLVELFLGSLGMDVTSCSSEQEVLKLTDYDFDIIVSDVMLASGKTGPDLVRGIRSKRPEIGCLFISGYKHGALSNADLAHPKTDFLAKPFSKSEFAKRVQALLAL